MRVARLTFIDRSLIKHLRSLLIRWYFTR